jgi:hypothetical protein
MVTIAEPQRELRAAYRGGSVGQAVSGALWLISSALATWSTPRAAILTLALGGALIFPVTWLVLRLLKANTRLSPGNTLDQLATQIAFTVPLGLPIVAGATLLHLYWFYPAVMILVGAHYLPFAFLYGTNAFLVLGGAMVTAGLMLGLYLHQPWMLGGWLTGALLVVFAFLLATLARTERVR